jgi:hypothetical protein
MIQTFSCSYNLPEHVVGSCWWLWFYVDYMEEWNTGRVEWWVLEAKPLTDSLE